MSNGAGNNVLGISWGNFGHLVTFLFLTFLISTISFFYSRSIRKYKDYEKMPKITFLIFYVIRWIRKNTYQIVGRSYKFAIPFFIYIISLFWFSNISAILGFDSIGNSLVVPLSLSLIIFVGTVASGLFYRGYRFFGDYMVWIRIRGHKVFPLIDPLKLIGEVSKILSLAFRLWGNSLAGSVIIFVIYHFSHSLFTQSTFEWLGPIVLPLLFFPLHIYFDVIAGTTQPLIFMLLTMCYWSMARYGESSEENDSSVNKDPTNFN